MVHRYGLDTIVKIQVVDKYGQKYQAEIVRFEPFQDFVFEVDYYDDEGLLITETVSHDRLILNEDKFYEKY